MVDHVPGDRIEYEALDEHFRQVPAFKKLTFLQIPEETTRVAMLVTDQIDVALCSVGSVSRLKEAGLRTVNLDGEQLGVQFYGVYDPRAKGMPTADARVREALSLAINRDEITRTFFEGAFQYLQAVTT